MTSLSKNLFKLYKAEKNISVPTLLITAEDDKIIHSKKTAKRLTKNKNVTWVEIKDTGHVPFEEQEQETLNAILNYINK
ncbi:MAG: alpha/beta hydrolase, partial [Ureaplasma sp.]|nr:alpha/beta hydrolase [Ureaplasma sp.]